MVWSVLFPTNVSRSCCIHITVLFPHQTLVVESELKPERKQVYIPDSIIIYFVLIVNQHSKISSSSNTNDQKQFLHFIVIFQIINYLLPLSKIQRLKCVKKKRKEKKANYKMDYKYLHQIDQLSIKFRPIYYMFSYKCYFQSCSLMNHKYE